MASLVAGDGECEHFLSGNLDTLINCGFEDLCDAEFDHFMSGSFDFNVPNPDYSQTADFQAAPPSIDAFRISPVQYAAGDISNTQMITGMPHCILASSLLPCRNSADGRY